MKKSLLLIALLLLVGSVLVACGEENSSTSTTGDTVGNEGDATPVDTPDDNTKNNSVEVNKGLLNVEITLPASFFEGEDMNQVIANAKEEGISDVKVNDDGSVVYKMPKSVHDKMINEMRESVLESVSDIVNSGDFPSIKDVTYNRSFSEFTLIVDKGAYENSFDGFAVFGIGIMGLYYQAFDGVSPDKNKVKINVEDITTGEVFNSITYPDDI